MRMRFNEEKSSEKENRKVASSLCGETFPSKKYLAMPWGLMPDLALNSVITLTRSLFYA